MKKNILIFWIGILAGCMTSPSYHLEQEGIALVQKGEYHTAIQKFQAALKLDPHFSCYLHLAKTYLLLHNPQKALDPAKKAASLSSELEPHLILAQIYFLLHKKTAAEKTLQSLLQTHSQNPFLYMAIGDIYLSSRKWNKAIDYYKKALSFNPQEDRIYVQLGRAYLFQELEKVQKLYQIKIPEKASPKEMLARMGHLITNSKISFSEAQLAFRKAAYLNPYNVEAHVMLGILAFHQAEYSEAALEWKQALELAPKSSFLYMALGLNHQCMKEYSQAAHCFKKARELAPNSVQPLMMEIFLLVLQKHYEKAIQKIIDSLPKFPNLSKNVFQAFAIEKERHIPWLISLLYSKNKKIANLSAQALSYLSNQPFSLDPKYWETWWKKEKKK